MQVQIRDQLSVLHTSILQRLDMNVSEEDRALLKELLRNTEAFQKEI